MARDLLALSPTRPSSPYLHTRPALPTNPSPYVPLRLAPRPLTGAAALGNHHTASAARVGRPPTSAARPPPRPPRPSSADLVPSGPSGPSAPRSFVWSGRSFGLGRARRLPSSGPRTTRPAHDLAAASGPRGAPVRASVAPQPAATAAQPHRRRPRNRETSTRAVRGRHPNFLVRLRATLAGVTAMCSDCACGPASAAVGAEQQGVDIDTFDGRRASA